MMNTREEKKWLRAILEGKITPGSKEWKRIREDEAFARIRRTIQKAENMDLGSRAKDVAEMWCVIEKNRPQGANRRYLRTWHWTAAVIALLIVGSTLWIIRQENNSIPFAKETFLTEYDTTQLTLIMASGERLHLSEFSGDTILQEGNVQIHRDVSKGLVYEYNGGEVTEENFNQLLIPRKCEYQLVLDDGTKIYLNAGSKLRYPTFFAGQTRKVYLEGEAYFEVARDSTRPFLVETAEQTIRVLGTSFNVYAYPAETMNYAVLVSGSVEVKDKQTGANRILRPGQQVTLDATTGKAVVQKVDVRQMIDWKNGMLIFDNQTLEQIMVKLSRWYDIEVVYRNQDVKKQVFKGNIPRYDSLSTVLETLGNVSGIRFDLNHHTVIVN